MKEKKSILVVTTSFPRFTGDVVGGGNFIYELCQKLKDSFNLFVLAPVMKGVKSEYEVNDIYVKRFNYFPGTFGDLIGKSSIIENLRLNKIKFFVVPFYLFFNLMAIIQIVKKNKIEIINAHWTMPSGFVSILYKIIFDKKIKVLVTAHGSDINISWGIIGRIVNKFVLKNADCITAVSNELKNKISDLGCKKNIEVIPMGINTEIFKPSYDSKLKSIIGVNGFMVLFVGIFNEVKGIEYLLGAMPEVVDKIPDCKLVLVGDGDIKEKLKILCRELKIENHVVFIGYVSQNELPKYYSSADVVVLPSISEGSPLVLPEALSCGAFVITSDLPIYRQYITDGENGFIVSPKNSNSIAEKVIYTFKNFETYKFTKINSIERIQNNFSWENIGLRYKNKMEKL